MTHTPEPLAFTGNGKIVWPEQRRIEAALAATAGIPTDALEAGAVRELVEALRMVLDEGHSYESEGLARDYARAALAKVQQP